MGRKGVKVGDALMSANIAGMPDTDHEAELEHWAHWAHPAPPFGADLTQVKTERERERARGRGRERDGETYQMKNTKGASNLLFRNKRGHQHMGAHVSYSIDRYSIYSIGSTHN